MKPELPEKLPGSEVAGLGGESSELVMPSDELRLASPELKPDGLWLLNWLNSARALSLADELSVEAPSLVEDWELNEPPLVLAKSEPVISGFSYAGFCEAIGVDDSFPTRIPSAASLSGPNWFVAPSLSAAAPDPGESSAPSVSPPSSAIVASSSGVGAWID